MPSRGRGGGKVFHIYIYCRKKKYPYCKWLGEKTQVLIAWLIADFLDSIFEWNQNDDFAWIVIGNQFYFQVLCPSLGTPIVHLDGG